MVLIRPATAMVKRKTRSRRPRKTGTGWKGKVNDFMRRSKPELKHIEFSNVAQQVDWDGKIDWITNIQKGDNLNQRNGVSVHVTSVLVEGNVQLAAGSTDAVIDIKLVMDKNNFLASVNPNPNQIYDYTGTAAAPYGRVPDDYTHQYKVLAQRRISLTRNGEQKRNFRMFIPINQDVTFGAGSTDRLKNACYLVFASDQAGTDPVNSVYIVRTYYTDS